MRQICSFYGQRKFLNAEVVFTENQILIDYYE